VIAQLKQDRAIRPDLFDFFGAIYREKLNEWLGERKLIIPYDLRAFWCETGGGDLFESETILGPFGRADLGDDVDTVNRFHWQDGMPIDWLVFHTGLGLTVVKMSSGEYANLRGDSYEVRETFRSLDDWYNQFIRKEYAPRYGLP
jgi:hypothetical protein